MENKEIKVFSENVEKVTTENVEKVTTENVEKVTTENVELLSSEKAVAVSDNNDDIFITEDDKFTVTIEYYLNGKVPSIKGWTDLYEPEGQSVKKFDLVFKYPSQQDVEKIMSAKSIGNLSTASMTDFLEAETARLNILVRSWTLKGKLSEMGKLHPNFIKAIRDKITDEIGGIGIY